MNPNPKKETNMRCDKTIETAARACHEANWAICEFHGDTSQPKWDDAPEWQRESAINGVANAVTGAGPEASHENWIEEKVNDGWTHGVVKDPEKKTHPCLVPYADLPPEQRIKDHVFIAIAVAVVQEAVAGA